MTEKEWLYELQHGRPHPDEMLRRGLLVWLVGGALFAFAMTTWFVCPL